MQLETIIQYLEINWDDQVLKSFVSRLDKRIEMISVFPEICKKSDRYHGARECLLTKHNSLFYIVEADIIYIVTLWDNRQDPELLIEFSQIK